MAQQTHTEDLITISDISTRLGQPNHRIRRAIRSLGIKPALLYANRFAAYPVSVVDQIAARLRWNDQHDTTAH